MIMKKATINRAYSLITVVAMFLLVKSGLLENRIAHAAFCETMAGYTCVDAGCPAGFNPAPAISCMDPSQLCCSPSASPGEDYADRCEELEQDTWEGAPSPLAIICPLVRYLNIVLFASAAVFVMMIFATAIKYALAQGDPKALQGAKGTLTWAILGFIVIIGVFTLLVIFKNVLGLKDNPILNPVGVLNDSLMDLLDKFGITNY